MTTGSTTLRDLLSHEWQDLGSLSAQVYDRLGIAMKPERLGRVLSNNYPDVEISDGILIRLKAQEVDHASPPPKPVREHEQHQRRRA